MIVRSLQGVSNVFIPGLCGLESVLIKGLMSSVNS